MVTALQGSLVTHTWDREEKEKRKGKIVQQSPTEPSKCCAFFQYFLHFFSATGVFNLFLVFSFPFLRIVNRKSNLYLAFMHPLNSSL